MDDYSRHGRHRTTGTMLTRHVDMSQPNLPYPFQVQVDMVDLDIDLGMGESVCGLI
jgi:hypothetical protein